MRYGGGTPPPYNASKLHSISQGCLLYGWVYNIVFNILHIVLTDFFKLSRFAVDFSAVMEYDVG